MNKRLYHIVAINEKSHTKTYLTGYPMPHDKCVVMMGKFNAPAKHARIQLEEVSK